VKAPKETKQELSERIKKTFMALSTSGNGG